MPYYPDNYEIIALIRETKYHYDIKSQSTDLSLDFFNDIVRV